MRRLNTLRNRLVALIFAITSAAVGFVYLYVVPQLESSLTAEKLRRLERVAANRAPELAASLRSGAARGRVSAEIDRIAQVTEARVTVLAARQGESGAEPAFVLADSTGEASASQSRYLPARTALASGVSASGVDNLGGTRVAGAAIPVERGGEPTWAVVLTSPLADVDDSVALIRRQILIAGAIALFLAGIAGYLASGAVSGRLERLRRAAERVASGEFDQPITLDSQDEIGQLARAFNHMQSRLQRLDSTRREFIANASHELRTPVFSLGGFIELLETENPTAAERREWMGEIRQQIDRLQKLTTDLLDLSRLDADALEVNRAEVDLTRVARAVAREFRPRARKLGAAIEVRGRGQVQALADPDRTAQIMRILLDNAITHTDEGTRVTATAVSENGAARLIVSDDGKGIDPRTAVRVFDRFYSADASPGSGLGLAIARELAELMGGSIELDSRRHFTAFTLTLPGARSRKAGSGARA